MDNDLKIRAAAVSLTANAILVSVKMLAGFITGSISILSEALHSMADLIVTILMFFAIKISASPADDEHKYGHGKFEDLSGAIEGALVFLVGIFVIYESFRKIIEGHHETSQLDFGMVVMGISAVVSFFVGNYILKVAKKTDSIALKADSYHIKTDFYICIGVFVSLLLVYTTGIAWLDIVAALIISIIIMRSGYVILKQALASLVDHALPFENEKMIYEIAERYLPKMISLHDIKTRKAGSVKLIEFHMSLPADMSIREGHQLCDDLEEAIENELNHTQVTIHMEPCLDVCKECHVYNQFPDNCYRYQDKLKRGETIT